jgi:hypothetical protein
MNRADEDALREKIANILAGGLATTTEPVPEDSEGLRAILSELAEIDPGDLEKKLVVSGFVDHPCDKDDHRCLECMYYRVHRKWCALPTLALPVEPEWWCRLWRI